ncbi:MAG: DUF3180 domain-containing protein [Janibacter sp.]
MLRAGLKTSTLVLVALVLTVLSWGIGRWWLTGGHPALQIGWLAGALLLGMAIVVVVTGSRMWRMRHGRTHVEPVVAARVLGLAQASALTGAAMGGLYLGQALLLLPDINFAGRGGLVLRFGLAAFGGLLMAIAGLLVQSWCRIDDDDDDEDSRAQRR